MLRELAEYLDDEGVAVKGHSLFYGYFPDNAPDADVVCLLEAGPELVDMIGPSDRSLRHKQVQVFGRGRTYEGARALTRNVVSALLGNAGLELTGWTILNIVGGQAQYVGLDDKRKHTFSANLTVHAREN